MKNFNYDKEQCRGAIKQLMKVRSIRKINLDNYFKAKNLENYTGVHSIKFDLQDGYVNVYSYKDNGRCGNAIEDATPEMYRSVYNAVYNIFQDEMTFPRNIRRNILVNICR